jgi:hypothetical protein
MGMFAEIVIVDYRLSFADQENVLPFSFFIKKWKFVISVSVCSKQMEVYVFC